MSAEKDTLQEDLVALMKDLDPASETVKQDFQDGWMDAMDKYVKSGTPTPASPSFSNTTGVKTLFQFEASSNVISATNIANACGAYVGSLLVSVGGTGPATNTATLTATTVLLPTILPTTEDNDYQILVDAIEAWLITVVWSIPLSSGSSLASLQFPPPEE